ncbi:hypothetical protein PS691_01236 [Pseudomonas fluorescens]|uniref:Lipoprotein n=1 Tax=Pseudomonas fluorescens TaxID=294 RepID=A0A5E7B219_PSEFL|nr:hypothetical protein PS691_01236 [Pseudomonas fluorescens]
MSKFIDIPALSFVVLTAVVLAACDQGETQTKRPSGNQCPPRNVLAIVDVLRSEEQDRVFNDQIIDAAVKLASQCDAHLEVLHAYDWTAVYIRTWALVHCHWPQGSTKCWEPAAPSVCRPTRIKGER